MEDKNNIVVEPSKGAISLIVKALKKNKLVEIPSEIILVEVKRDDGVIFEELKKLNNSVKDLKKTVWWIEKMVKEI